MRKSSARLQKMVGRTAGDPHSAELGFTKPPPVRAPRHFRLQQGVGRCVFRKQVEEHVDNGEKFVEDGDGKYGTRSL